MKVCPTCQENNHDAAERCIMCGALLPTLPERGVPSPSAAPGELLLPAGPEKLPPGTLAVAVYHDAEPRVVAYVPIETDITLIGREDARRGIFPDVDLARVDDTCVQADGVSREHAHLIRRGHDLLLEVLPGSTGTQLNRRIVAPGEVVTVAIGDRIILAGRVRLKIVSF